MRPLLLALIMAMVCAVSSIAQTFNATWHVTNFVSQATQLTRVTLTPLAPFVDYTNSILDDTPIIGQTDTNGAVTFSNLQAGYSYKFELDTLFKRVIRTNGFPVGLTGSVEAEPYNGVWLPSMTIFAYTSTNTMYVVYSNLFTIITNLNAAGYGITNLGYISTSNLWVNGVQITGNGTSPTGPAGGFLSGTYPNPTLNASASIPGAQVTGTVPNATTAGSFTGSLSGNVTGTQSATVVSSVGSAALPAGQITGTIPNTVLPHDGSYLTNIFYNTVLQYGAVGDGVTDDTAALQKMLNAGGTIFLGTNTYYVGNLFLTNNTQIFGDGAVLKFKSGVTNALLGGLGVSSNLYIEGVTLDGGNYVQNGSLGTRHGIWLNPAAQNAVVISATGVGFTGYGLVVNATNLAPNVSYNSSTPIISGCHFYDNYTGIALLSTATSWGEYIQVIGCDAHNNSYGIEADAGNHKIQGGFYNSNVYTGICINNASGANNGAHGSIVGVTANHNGICAVAMTNINSGYGELVKDCIFYADSFYLQNVNGAEISGCSFDAGGVFVTWSGCTNIFFHDNVCNASWGWGTGGDATHYGVNPQDGSLVHYNNYSTTDSTSNDRNWYFDAQGNAHFANTLYGGTFNGNGAGLTNIQATNIVGLGSGSQTPWTSDINGNGHKLTNVASISIGSGSAGSLSLSNAAGNFATTVQGGNVASNITFTLPASASSGTLIWTNNGGTMTAGWLAPSNGIIASDGTNFYYTNSAGVGSSSTWDTVGGAAINSFNPLNGQVLYWGDNLDQAASTSSSTVVATAQKTCTVKDVLVMVRGNGTVGSSENVPIYLTNFTQATGVFLGNMQWTSGYIKLHTNGLSFGLTLNDSYALYSVDPTWATPPTGITVFHKIRDRLLLLILTARCHAVAAFGGVIQTWAETNATATSTITLSNGIPAGTYAVFPLGWEAQFTFYLTNVVDSRGNVWRILGTNACCTVHQDATVAAPITTALQAGDTITLMWQTNSATITKGGSIMYLTGVSLTSNPEAVSNTSVTGSTVETAVATTNNFDLIFGEVTVDQVNSVVTNVGTFTYIGSDLYAHVNGSTDGLGNYYAYKLGTLSGNYSLGWTLTSNGVPVSQAYLGNAYAFTPSNVYGTSLTGNVKLSGNVSMK